MDKDKVDTIRAEVGQSTVGLIARHVRGGGAWSRAVVYLVQLEEAAYSLAQAAAGADGPEARDNILEILEQLRTRIAEGQSDRRRAQYWNLPGRHADPATDAGGVLGHACAQETTRPEQRQALERGLTEASAVLVKESAIDLEDLIVVADKWGRILRELSRAGREAG